MRREAISRGTLALATLGVVAQAPVADRNAQGCSTVRRTSVKAIRISTTAVMTPALMAAIPTPRDCRENHKAAASPRRPFSLTDLLASDHHDLRANLHAAVKID